MVFRCNLALTIWQSAFYIFTLNVRDGNGVCECRRMLMPQHGATINDTVKVAHSNRTLTNAVIEMLDVNNLESIHSCNYDGDLRASRCPRGFETVKSIGHTEHYYCVLISVPQAWNNTCAQWMATEIIDLFYDGHTDRSATEKRKLFQYVRTKVMEANGDGSGALKNEFWMPARRRLHYEPITWTLPGRYYGEMVDFSDSNVEIIEYRKNGDCMTMSLIGRTDAVASVVDCLVELPVVCILTESDVGRTPLKWAKDVAVTATATANCMQVVRAQQNDSLECQHYFRLESQHSVADFFRMVETTHDTLRPDELCRIEVDDNSSAALRLSNRCNAAEVDAYLRWKTGNSTLVPVIDRHGHWQFRPDGDYDCAICRVSQWTGGSAVPLRPVRLSLRFDRSRRQLTLTIYSRQSLWRSSNEDVGVNCFTNAGGRLVERVAVRSVKGDFRSDSAEPMLLFTSETITSKVERTMSKAVYNIEISDDGPGLYWCEGYSLQSSTNVRTDRVIAYRQHNAITFAAAIKLQCVDCFDLITKPSALMRAAKRVKTVLQQCSDRLMSIESVRIMAVEGINEESSGTARLIVHISVECDSAETDESGSREEDEPDDEDWPTHDDVDLAVMRASNLLHKLLNSCTATDLTFYTPKSIEYCLPDATMRGWSMVRIREASVPSTLCIQTNGLPLTRRCVGDFLYGGEWEPLHKNQSNWPENDPATVANQTQCSSESLSAVTENLYQITKLLALSSSTQLLDTLQNLTATPQLFIPADLFYLSQAMRSFGTKPNWLVQNSPESITANDLPPAYLVSATKILNNVMCVHENVAKLSQQSLNTTNTLLDAFDNIINKMAVNLSLSDTNYDAGTIASITGKLIVAIVDPFVRNVSGVALFRINNFASTTTSTSTVTTTTTTATATATTTNQLPNDKMAATVPTLTVEDNLATDFQLRWLYTNDTPSNLMDVAQDGLLEIAAFIPQTLFDKIILANINRTSMPIVFTIYSNDILFQNSQVGNVNHRPSGKILSITIPGVDTNLPELLPIIFRIANQENNATNETLINHCGYWNFAVTDNTTSTWLDDGCELIVSTVGTEINPIVQCGCTHLTHFAYLSLGTFYVSTDSSPGVAVIAIHKTAFDMINLLGCSLSLIGVAGIVVTAIVFRVWREKASTKVLLHLATSLGLQLFGIGFVSMEAIHIQVQSFTQRRWNECVLLGGFLHYIDLCTFAWMLITAYLQFLRYVRVLGRTKPKRFFQKAFLIGWCIPLLPVVCLIVFTPESYYPLANMNTVHICYPTGYALYYAVLVPIGSIVAANLIVFLMVIHSVLCQNGQFCTSVDKNRTITQLRLFIFLFFLFGLSWIFGLLAMAKAGLVFSYLFCITTTAQGFVLFVYFIIMDPVTRRLWSNACAYRARCCFKSKSIEL